MHQETVLDISGLTTVFRIAGGEVTAVRNFDLSVAAGETVALVGESGSGKSVASLSIMGLLPPGIGSIAAGTVRLRRKSGAVVELKAIDGETLRSVRGNDIGMVFQEPLTSLNPVYTIGEQIAEPIRIHLGKSHRAAMADAVRLLDDVGIPRSAPPRRAIPARALGRHAAAGDDRHGARVQPGAAHCGRAHHGRWTSPSRRRSSIC